MCKLMKSLHGLQRSPSQKGWMVFCFVCVFTQSKHNCCLCIKKVNDGVSLDSFMLALYVDDMLTIAKNISDITKL